MRRLPAFLLGLFCGYLLAGWVRELVYLISHHATFPGGGEPIEYMGFASLALFSVLGLVSGLRELFFRPGVPEAGRKLGLVTRTLRAIGWMVAGFGAVGVSTMVTTPDMTITPDGLATFWSGAVVASVVGGTLLFLFRKGPVSPAYLCLFVSGSLGMIFALVPLWLPVIFPPALATLASQGWQATGEEGTLSLYRENPIPPESTVTLKRIFRPLAITLASDEVGDITSLRGLNNLTELYLRGTRVTDLSPLREDFGLRELELGWADVADLSALRELKHLRRLALIGAVVRDVSPLEGLTELSYLDLRSTQVVDISPLRDLTRLTTLYLRSTNVTDAAPLRGLHQLETLDLGGAPIGDISGLSELTVLSTLVLDGTNVSDVTALRGLTNLQELDLSSTQVTDISALTGLKNLRKLVLAGTNVTDVSAFENRPDLDLYLP